MFHKEGTPNILRNYFLHSVLLLSDYLISTNWIKMTLQIMRLFFPNYHFAVFRNQNVP